MLLAWSNTHYSDMVKAPVRLSAIHLFVASTSVALAPCRLTSAALAMKLLGNLTTSNVAAASVTIPALSTARVRKV